MFKVLTLEDMPLIIKFLRVANKLSEDTVKMIQDQIHTNMIITAKVEKEISSMIIINLINNNYYVSNFIGVENTIDDLKELIGFTVEVITHDARGLNIIYDNFPYSEIMNEVFTSNGFKFNYLNMLKEAIPNQVYRTKYNLVLNDKNEDVREYIFSHHVETLKSFNEYMGVSSVSLPNIEDIHLDNINIVVARGKDNRVLGVARFSLITDSIYINSLYAEDREIYIDLIHLIANLTNRRLEIGLYPIRKELIVILKELGFVVNNADYFYKIN
ncbi:MAG: hypothetical protein OSJ70_07780 [Bacilli bacterium]|nr:hypothetical protein [Bacilli bacterium]